ncbi:hypothetical protein LPB67_15620 [Undibacterium sp. Jales W-56]|uniref:hypothetical protein n=1 Tax=Undibacterium sp. Jales W-56 TaxID=2897325 RepID=UPI0021CE8594|nr:hypothetical protein [Undibacterium sp. Jales W-56]MCU6435205.1 hypothetical protein [Undibacterium sp. Jales W-56]
MEIFYRNLFFQSNYDTGAISKIQQDLPYQNALIDAEQHGKSGESHDPRGQMAL